jgi:hypothetical protein
MQAWVHLHQSAANTIQQELGNITVLLTKMSPLKYSYFSAATSSQKNKEKQVYNYYLFLNYDPPTGVGNMFCLALITAH